MTIASSATQARYTSTGAGLQYAFPNKIFAASDLVVIIIDAQGNIYPFTNFANATLGLSYTVQGVDVDTGCTVVFSAVQTAGVIIDIRSLTPELQSTSIKNQGNFLPELHEEAFDKNTRETQDLYRLTYTFGVHGPDTESAAWPALPAASARKGLSLMFDAVTGLPVVGVPTTQTLTQQILGLLLYPRTASEVASGIFPANYAYPELSQSRYNTAADFVTVSSYVMTNFPTTSIYTSKGGGYLNAGNVAWNINNAAGDPPHIFEVSSDNLAIQTIRFNTYGTSFANDMHWCRYRGNQVTPTVIKLGDFFMSMGFRGWDGSGTLSQSALAFQALTVEDWSVPATGAKFHFETTRAGTNALARLPMIDITGSGMGIGPFGTTAAWNANYRVLEFNPGCALRSNVATGLELSITNNSYVDTGAVNRYGSAGAAAQYLQTQQSHVFNQAPTGASGGAVTLTEVGRFDSTGNLVVGANGAGVGRGYHNILNNAAEGTSILLVRSEATAGPTSASFAAVAAGGANAAACAVTLGKNNATSRSLNAGGTVNASGTDYAEYMTKADGCGLIQKGDIAGIDAAGLLTDVWDHAVSFLVKSTSPSYVGGDAWGHEDVVGVKPEAPVLVEPDFAGIRHPGAHSTLWTEKPALFKQEIAAHARTCAQHAKDAAAHAQLCETTRAVHKQIALPAYEKERAAWEEKHQAARARVDRMAFAGRVPVNVKGAAPGDYIVPAQGGNGEIIGLFLTHPSFEEYMHSVGRVIAVLPDGRAEIIVKVA